MNSEKDEIWGSPRRRDLGLPGHRPPEPNVSEGHAHGPEAYERAAEMAYDNITRIQQESPYTRTEVVEYVVHDQRLYIGVWVIAGVSAVFTFLTFSFPLLVVTVLLVLLALNSDPRTERMDRG